MTRKKIVLIGAGGFGREVFAFINKEEFEVVGFLDHSNPKNLEILIFGNDDIIPRLKSFNIHHAAITIGAINKRRLLMGKCHSFGTIMPNIIHNSAQIFSTINTDNGIIIYPNVVIMSDVLIGKGCLINSGVTIGHDVHIGEFSNINPGVNLAGNINIGEGTLIGLGAAIRENINIGANVIIGAGSVVVKDIPSNSRAYGVPAKIIKE